MILAKTSLRGSIGGGDSAYGYPHFSGYSLSKVSVVRTVENIGIVFKKDYKTRTL